MRQPLAAAAAAPRGPAETSVDDGLRAMLAALTFATLLTSCAGPTLSPFLLEIARDLGVELVQVSAFISIMNVAWGVCALLAGAASDRVGRKAVLVSSLVILGLCLFGQAAAPTYLLGLLTQVGVGIGGGSFTGTVFAAVSDRVPAERRGSALGWVLTGQSLSLLVGVPAFTYVGSILGWRGALGAEAIATLIGATVVWWVVPGAARVEARPAGGSLREAVDGRTIVLLFASVAERICFVSVAVYLATFLIGVYGTPLSVIASVLAINALANVAGNLLGGWLSDRVIARPLLFAGMSLGAGLLALPALGWSPGLWITVALCFGYTLLNATGRPSIVATLADVPAQVRGTVMGVNMTFASAGWIIAATLGGWLITTFGYTSLGTLGFAAGACGAVLALLGSRLPVRQYAR
ncbi:MAG: MFS transporter [Chloroflexota bacterium]